MVVDKEEEASLSLWMLPLVELITVFRHPPTPYLYVIYVAQCLTYVFKNVT